MTLLTLYRALRASLLALAPFLLLSGAQSQGAKKSAPAVNAIESDSDHERERAQWFMHGRVVPGKSAAQLRLRAYQKKMQARAARLARTQSANLQPSGFAGGWTPLGPLPLASDASGDGFQNYNQVSGRATSVAIDPADPSGNTVYIGGAQGGVWKSTNAAASVAASVDWTPLTDDQATLSIGAIAIQPGNLNPATSLILAGTGEADNSGDSYFGLGILRSADGGNTWTLASTANGGALSFAGLGATRMAFSMANGQTNTVVAAMAASLEGITAGALTNNTYRGLYTSTDAGQTWTYDALFSGPNETTSATSVVYNAAAGLFFAALRYHGFYSSVDGLTWTRLSNQPGGGGLLSTTACPQDYVATCPIYRGEISVVTGRNEMYVWFVSADSNGNPVDQGIWVSTNSGASWTQISDIGIVNCGDFNGCGVEQGFYNLDLLALPNGSSATDLYAGAVNLYKCSITSINQGCANTPFLNLTHVYGCDPLSALAHVHPDEHALAYTIPTAGSATGADLMYFANDGGIYRTLDGFTGLASGSCTGTNQFDDLNQNLGPMTQFVSFSQHPTNADMILGGTQDNGSPASIAATTNPGWGNVLSGDGGFNAIDSITGDWFASNPDMGLGTLNIQQCPSGENCNDSLFNVVISSSDIGGDDGAFYFPYILDPQSASTLLLGTCRVWSGPRAGGAFTLLSLNFDTLGIGACAGTEINTVRSIAAGGASNASGSQVIYVTTDGPGPSAPSAPIGGNVWVTKNAAAVSGTASTFSNVTLNGPGGSSINPNQFPISSVAIDNSDPSGNTAYVTVMGFTGSGGHVWQTTNAGASWMDFSGTATSAIPDSPANAVVIDSIAHMVFVGTDVGVFESSTTAAAWVEVGPIPSPTGGSTGFLPDVAVTALALFSSGGQKLLRASTYGRGIWQFNLLAVPDFTIAVSDTPLTVFTGYPGIYDGTLVSVNLYDNSVVLSCVEGASTPSPCTPNFSSYIPTQAGTPFSISTGPSPIGDYTFNLQGSGSDPANTMHTATLLLHVVNLILTTPSPTSVTDPRGTTSPPVSFQLEAQGSFTQSVTMSCSFTPSISGGACAFTPGAVVNPTSTSPTNMTVTVTVPAATTAGSYTVTLQATTPGAPPNLTTSFGLVVTENPDFIFSEPVPFPNVKIGSIGTSGPITISSQDGFAGTVSLSCPSTLGPGSCSISPASVTTFPATATLAINGTSFSPGAYQVAVQGTSGSITNSLDVPFNIGDYAIAGPASLSSAPSGQVLATLALTSLYSYSGQINTSCDATMLPGAQCALSPATNISVAAGAVVPVTVSINIPNSAASGTYNVVINTNDVTGTPSHSRAIALTIGQDFTIGSLTPTPQTITPGESASYNFSVLPVGTSFNNAVSFSCSGGPAISLCSFTPNQVTPGSNSAAVVMTITTSATSARLLPPQRYETPRFYAICLVLPGFMLFAAGAGGIRRRNISRPISVVGLFLLALLASCGGVGINGTSTTGLQGTQPGSYSIIVTGSAGTLTHQTPAATLIVNQ